MDEPLVSPVAWRRRRTRHHYVGTLAATDAGLRLQGREPALGIELSLSIPFSEIEAVQPPNGTEDFLIGGPAVVLRVAGAEAVLMRDVGPGDRTAALADQLQGLLDQLRVPDRSRLKAAGRSEDEG